MPTSVTSSLPLAAGKRVSSIDLLRGTVMLIMALDHVRDYFHADAYLYDPTDLEHTSVVLFFTRWITHFCAPVFVFLAGTSAYLYGNKRSRKELSFFLFTRGLWLVLAELFIVTLGWTFNLFYSIYILQVIWAIGASMMLLAALIYLPRPLLLLIGILFIGAHNLLDTVHVPGNNAGAFIWALVHERNAFHFGHFNFLVGYPVVPWLGIMITGYCFGILYTPGYDAVKRRKTLRLLGFGAILLFILVRLSNWYGDPSHWQTQRNGAFTLLSFLNTTKYPPSFLYTLMTLGPALLFLAATEKPLNAFTEKIVVFGRVPMFYYLLHIFLIHLLAVVALVLTGRPWQQMVVDNWVTAVPQLQGYGFSLLVTYLIWIVLLVVLYPLCKWYDRYKRTHQQQQWWLSYL